MRTTWVEVEVGMTVVATDGTRWPVTRKAYRDGWWWFELGGSEKVARRPDAPVDVLVPTMEEAEEMVARVLGATVVQRRIIAVEEFAAKPNSKWARAALASHMFNQHGISISPTAHVENNDMPGLIREHALAHANPATIPVPHVHVGAHEL